MPRALMPPSAFCSHPVTPRSSNRVEEEEEEEEEEERMRTRARAVSGLLLVLGLGLRGSGSPSSLLLTTCVLRNHGNR